MLVLREIGSEHFFEGRLVDAVELLGGIAQKRHKRLGLGKPLKRTVIGGLQEIGKPLPEGEG